MAESIQVRGGQNLSRIARDLKEAGDRKLRNELLRGVRKAARGAIPDVVSAAEAKLPKSGGLAERVAGQRWSARSSLGGSVAKVKIVGQGMQELKLIDSGFVRHPTFAHRLSLFAANPLNGGRMVGRRMGEWHTQKVVPGFFTKTMEDKAPEVRREIEGVMRDVARKIERGV